MDLLAEIGVHLAEGLLQWLLSPFYWLAIILIAMYYRRQVTLERRLFSVKMHSWAEQTWHAWLGGLIAGLIVSAAAIGLGITLTSEVVIALWIVALLLLLVRVRFLCLAYSASVLALLQFGLRVFAPDWTVEGWGGTMIAAIRDMDAAGLLVLVALLHAAEAWLIRKQAARMAGPLFMESKRGGIVGAYQMQSLWPVPLMLLFPTATAGSPLPWTPLFGGDSWLQGWSLIAFPVMIGFSELTFTRLPQEKAAVSASRLFAYAAVLLAFGLAASWWPPLVPVAALVALVLHEALIWYSRREESERSPVFTQDARGLRVLAVLPDSPAEELGIRIGEVIAKANGIPVRTKEQLHQALRSNAAFCKLEVYDANGEVRFLQRALYAGEHHQLGVLLAPDNSVGYVAVTRQPSFFALLAAPWARLKRGFGTKQDEQEMSTGDDKADKHDDAHRQTAATDTSI
ncbi:PDZ domain-containing protein [Paenibacillus apiarius]|uniref:PDZ domain-containing protein n=1 Tax=Paenibacillus apiarius TaxID=46240 RepID=A0ABT4DSD4_9BACL|nr:PDZ domain-containing protein [Paenibacillus apiarius]MCY9514147.1 PDZ domain-containing protein [Paenibacillus apiarius]MCY9520270.1 PDZ domain-containing protein [Paenibacillus apiarius]MCY9550388.1 PDZ domain-containing protein [Paenibacillus apiarius]MCY9557450.1 PDZ domain-containing protein [Paenibacillus apiarius]MCY9682371.1 PDZ domain-containing protein [Paenibacillus apiarius]